jgi:hypothetical protein
MCVAGPQSQEELAKARKELDELLTQGFREPKRWVGMACRLDYLTLSNIAAVMTALSLVPQIRLASPLKRSRCENTECRSFLNDPGTKWRFGEPPSYELANLQYIKGKTMNHPDGSLEQIVVIP